MSKYEELEKEVLESYLVPPESLEEQKERIFPYLTTLRDWGEINMPMEAPQVLRDQFSLTRAQSRLWFNFWAEHLRLDQERIEAADKQQEELEKTIEKGLEL